MLNSNVGSARAIVGDRKRVKVSENLSFRARCLPRERENRCAADNSARFYSACRIKLKYKTRARAGTVISAAERKPAIFSRRAIYGCVTSSTARVLSNLFHI